MLSFCNEVDAVLTWSIGRQEGAAAASAARMRMYLGPILSLLVL
jgi:hypothetical protein